MKAMDLKLLSYIVAVAEEKTILQAARSLFISQPALSQSIKKAEDELGVKLFTRMGNTLALTSSGEVVVQEGRKLLQGREYLLARLAHLSEKHREVLRFGVSPFYSKYYLPGVYTYYARHLPDIKLEIIEKISVELEEDVVRGELDFCFVPAYPARPELTYRTVSIEEVLLGVPAGHPANAYAVPSSSLPNIDLSCLRNEPFILQPPEQKIAKMLSRIFHHVGFSPNVVYETINWDTVHSLICCGLGLGFLPEILLETPMLCIHPNVYRLTGIDATRPYAVAYLHGKVLSHTAEQLIDVFAGNLACLKAAMPLHPSAETGANGRAAMP